VLVTFAGAVLFACRTYQQSANKATHFFWGMCVCPSIHAGSRTHTLCVCDRTNCVTNVVSDVKQSSPCLNKGMAVHRE
jgi:hypothetical protein